MRYELEIEGMTCPSCARGVEQALAGTTGVKQATVNYPTMLATVIAEPGVGTDALREVVAQAGYRVSAIRDAARVAPARDRPTASAPSSSSTQGESGAGVEYDLLIIGSGAGGVAAAIRASELGATAAVVERADIVGGTCVNVGCIPSKYLMEAAHHYHAARTGFPGIGPSEPQLAWDRVLEHKRQLVASLRQQKYTDVLEAYEGVTLLRGHAELRPEQPGDAVLVRVGDRDVRARKVVVATGTRPAMPPIPGLADVGALDSTSAMELERLPASMLVIGAGTIGLELGQMFQRFGVRVIVVEATARILPMESAEVSFVLQQALAAEGMEFHLGTRVTRVTRAERAAGGVRLEVAQGRVTTYLEAERVLVATGREPNVEGLGLDQARVRTDARGYVAVDGYMRTSNPRVFAAGDVTGGANYVYVAALQGGIAAQAALSEIVGEEPIAADLGNVPRVTFTDPQVAAVGHTESQARAEGLMTETTSLPVEYIPRAAVSSRRLGTVTLVAEAGTDRLLGAHVVAPNAGDFIGEAALAVRFGLTKSDLVSMPHPYLTWGEAIRLAVQTFTKDVAKLSCCA